jgi:hypothetical protein
LSCEAWVASREADFRSVSAACYRYSVDQVARAQGRAVLCFGDSLVKTGVAPRVLDQHGAGPSLNLACLGARPAFSYFLLKRAIDRGASPRAIVVDFHASQIHGDPLLDFEGLADVLDPLETLSYARTCRDPMMYAWMTAYQALPSLRSRANLRSAVVERLAGRPIAGYDVKTRPVFETWDREGGAHLLDVGGEEGRDGRFSDERLVSTLGPWYCHPANAVYIKKFLDLAARRRIAVYWLLPPIHPRLQARSDASGDTDRYDRLVRSAERAYPNLIVVDARRSGFSPGWFSDGNHLRATGARRFSALVADAIAANSPSTTRRIVLGPPPDGGPVRR